LNFIEKIIEGCGKYISWVTTLLVIVIGIDVFIRQVFGFSQTWILELEWELFAAIFLIGASYTLKHDKHVRVDVFYTNFSETKKAWVNLIGTIVLCIPWTVLLIQKSYHYAMNSWYIREGSSNPGGLPARYVIKFVMLLGFCLLLIQAFALVIKSSNKIRESWK
jgi:TRAP-type mannitol/chloroaromatic compound transport system permease small subunit